MANNREISQFAGLVTVADSTNNVSLGNTFLLSGNARLGVGTDNPAVKTHISDSTSSVGVTGTEILRVANTRLNTGTGAVAIRLVNNEIAGENQYTRAQIAAELDTPGTNDNTGRLMFATANSSGTLVERLRITSSGTIGIGLTNPTSILHTISDSSAPSSTVSPAFFFSSGNSADSPAMEIRQGRFNKDVLTLSSNQSLSANLLRAHENGTNRLVLTGAGNLLVGTTSSDGSESNTAIVSAGCFKTASGAVSTTSGSAATFVTLSTQTISYYIVSVALNAVDTASYSAVTLVAQQSTSIKLASLMTGSLISISNTGTALKVTQSSGVNQTVFWTITRIMN